MAEAFPGTLCVTEEAARIATKSAAAIFHRHGSVDGTKGHQAGAAISPSNIAYVGSGTACLARGGLMHLRKIAGFTPTPAVLSRWKKQGRSRSGSTPSATNAASASRTPGQVQRPWLSPQKSHQEGDRDAYIGDIGVQDMTSGWIVTLKFLPRLRRAKADHLPRL